MRVISLVPSWTETLIQAGVNVVGRTRYCIHPRAEVAAIPAVGGTKKVNWGKVEELSPDLVIFDKEENTKEMAESCSFPWIATHVEKVEDVQPNIQLLAEKIKNAKLEKLAHRWSQITPMQERDRVEELPVLEWVKKPTGKVERLLYLIWKDPWMAVGGNTFISSVLLNMGYGPFLTSLDDKYPVVELGDFNSENTVLLFSSEPYPFAQKKEMIAELPFASAIVDGECYSWFGLRSLEFLESL